MLFVGPSSEQVALARGAYVVANWCSIYGYGQTISVCILNLFFHWRLLVGPFPYHLITVVTMRRDTQYLSQALHLDDLKLVYVWFEESMFLTHFDLVGRICVRKRDIFVLVEMLAFFQRHYVSDVNGAIACLILLWTSVRTSGLFSWTNDPKYLNS